MSWLGKIFGGASAATKLPPVEAPKVKAKQQTYPSHVTTTAKSTSAVRRVDRQLANTDLLSYRTDVDSRKVIRNLAASNPDLAGAKNAYLRVALTQKYKCLARNMDGTFSLEGTQLAHELLRRFDLVPNYAVDGFSQTASMRSLSEVLGSEMILEGAFAFELVLDKARLPAKLAPISVTQIKFYDDDRGLRPVQVVGGEEIDLDLPTFFYTSLDQDLLTPYPSSPFESAIQPVLADAEYTNDLRRVLKRAVHPRLQAIIDNEMARKMAPPEAMADPAKLVEYLNALRTQVEDVVNGLSPEDALVTFDMIEFSYVSGGKEDVPDVIETVQQVLNAKMATGAKTLPSVLGHGAGTQNMASAETLLFMKNADGIVRVKLNEAYSKALTLAVRLFGLDVAVEFEYDPIELRPEGELEAFRQMRQERILRQLSLGWITDEEACVLITGQLPAPGFTPMAGTLFMEQMATDNPANPYSGTSNGGEGGGAMNQTLKPKGPKQSKGKAK